MIIWIASYPRSGNRFARMLLSRSFHEATGNIYPRPSEERWVGRDSEINFHDDPDAMVRARRSEQLVFVKTHRLPDPEDDSRPADRLNPASRGRVARGRDRRL